MDCMLPLPGDRWSAQQYLKHWLGLIFPLYFEQLLHPFFNSILALDADARVAVVQNAFPTLKAGIVAGQVGRLGSIAAG